ncbi:MAG TPA: DegT/DnrJ/EryC1/StrS family aminotransferase [Chthoniobacterales bacterium]
MTVPLLDLKLQYGPLRDEIQQRIAEVCDTQVFCLGPRVAELEKEVAAYSGAKHAFGTSSGTDAQLVLLMALGIGPGDAVLTTPYTFFATAGCVSRVGATPVFIDIDLQTYNLSPAALRTFLEEKCHRLENDIIITANGLRVKAVIPVHLFGCCAEMTDILAIGHEYGLHVMEDAAQSIGAEYLLNGGIGKSGSMGDSGYFSFYPTKNLGAFGDAGMATCASPDLAAKVDAMRNHGMAPRYFHAVIGGNFRMDAIQAAVLSVKLRHLDAWSDKRRENAALYRRLFVEAGLTAKVVLPIEPYADRGLRHHHIYNQYVIRAPDRNKLRDFLQSKGIGCEIYYPLSLHEQECFRDLGYEAGDFPNSERAAAESLALPIFPELQPEQLECVVRSIREFGDATGW